MHTKLALVAVLIASSATAWADQPIVGLITKTDTGPFFVKMKEGAQQGAQAHGVKLLTAAGKIDGDNATQVTAIENMVTAGAKTILITPNDSKAIVPAIKKARGAGVMVIALDSPTDPVDAVDALYATDNYKAGLLIGEYAKAALNGATPKAVTMDVLPGHQLGAMRHNGFVKGLGLPSLDAKTNQLAMPPEVVCAADTSGDRAKAKVGMENCLQKDSDINVVYAVNEPAAAGAYSALKAAGKEKGVIVVAVDGSCDGIANVEAGVINASSQQYPLKMASMGIDAAVEFAKTGKKPSGYVDTGVTLIAAVAKPGVDSKDVKTGLELCWGKK